MSNGLQPKPPLTTTLAGHVIASILLHQSNNYWHLAFRHFFRGAIPVPLHVDDWRWGEVAAGLPPVGPSMLKEQRSMTLQGTLRREERHLVVDSNIALGTKH